MNINDVKELILTIDKTSIQKVEIEEKDLRIRISKAVDADDRVYDIKERQEAMKKPMQEAQKNIEVDSKDIYIVKSPIVGAFYSAPSSDSDPFVKAGDYVKKDQSLCIIEAMKIMNEIQSEESGEIIEILVENEDIVEYGQPLMKIRR